MLGATATLGVRPPDVLFRRPGIAHAAAQQLLRDTFYAQCVEHSAEDAAFVAWRPDVRLATLPVVVEGKRTCKPEPSVGGESGVAVVVSTHNGSFVYYEALLHSLAHLVQDQQWHLASVFSDADDAHSMLQRLATTFEELHVAGAHTRFLIFGHTPPAGAMLVHHPPVSMNLQCAKKLWALEHISHEHEHMLLLDDDFTIGRPVSLAVELTSFLQRPLLYATHPYLRMEHLALRAINELLLQGSGMSRAMPHFLPLDPEPAWFIQRTFFRGLMAHLRTTFNASTDYNAVFAAIVEHRSLLWEVCLYRLFVHTRSPSFFTLVAHETISPVEHRHNMLPSADRNSYANFLYDMRLTDADRAWLLDANTSVSCYVRRWSALAAAWRRLAHAPVPSDDATCPQCWLITHNDRFECQPCCCRPRWPGMPRGHLSKEAHSTVQVWGPDGRNAAWPRQECDVG